MYLPLSFWCSKNGDFPLRLRFCGRSFGQGGDFDGSSGEADDVADVRTSSTDYSTDSTVRYVKVGGFLTT